MSQGSTWAVTGVEGRDKGSLIPTPPVSAALDICARTSHILCPLLPLCGALDCACDTHGISMCVHVCPMCVSPCLNLLDAPCRNSWKALGFKTHWKFLSSPHPHTLGTQGGIKGRGRGGTCFCSLDARKCV